MKNFFAILVALLIVGSSLNAQVLTTYIGGTVTGQSTGLAIAGHQVNIIDSINGFTITTYTNANGYFMEPVLITPGIASFFLVQTYGLCGPNDVYYQTLVVVPNSVNLADFVVCETTINPPVCQANFSFTQNTGPNCPLQVEFSDLSTSSQPVVQWFWSFGDSTSSTLANPSHCYTAPGTYYACLTIITAAGCSSVSCLPVTVGNATSNYQLTGNVTAGSANLQNGIDLLMGASGLSYTSMITNGLYSFQNIPGDSYILLAIPMDSTLTGYIPTYHDSALFWNSAIQLLVSSDTTANVFLQSVSTASGPGTIAGTIIWNGGQKCIGYTLPQFRGPEDIAVILTNESNQLQRFTFSSANGSFGFANLPYGTYVMHIELPGHYMEPFTLEIDENHQNLNGFIVDMDMGTITLLGIESLASNEKLLVGPNPIDHFLTIRFDDQITNIESVKVFNSQAKLMFHSKPMPHQENLIIDAKTWIKGVYILEIRLANQEVIRRKIVR
jgi:hypothetical protein